MADFKAAIRESFVYSSFKELIKSEKKFDNKELIIELWHESAGPIPINNENIRISSINNRFNSPLASTAYIKNSNGGLFDLFVIKDNKKIREMNAEQLFNNLKSDANNFIASIDANNQEKTDELVSRKIKIKEINSKLLDIMSSTNCQLTIIDLHKNLLILRASKYGDTFINSSIGNRFIINVVKEFSDFEGNRQSDDVTPRGSSVQVSKLLGSLKNIGKEFKELNKIASKIVSKLISTLGKKNYNAFRSIINEQTENVVGTLVGREAVLSLDEIYEFIKVSDKIARERILPQFK